MLWCQRNEFTTWWAQDALVAQEISLKTTKASWLHPVREMSLPLPGIAMQLAKDSVPGPSWPYFLQPRCQWPVNHVCWIHGHDNFTLVTTHGNIDDKRFTTRYIYILEFDTVIKNHLSHENTPLLQVKLAYDWPYEIAIMWNQCLETPPPSTVSELGPFCAFALLFSGIFQFHPGQAALWQASP